MRLLRSSRSSMRSPREGQLRRIYKRTPTENTHPSSDSTFYQPRPANIIPATVDSASLIVPSYLSIAAQFLTALPESECFWSPRRWRDFAISIPGTVGPSIVLKEAVHCIKGTAFQERAYAEFYHARAITSLRKALSDKVEAVSAETLCAMLLLQMYEVDWFLNLEEIYRPWNGSDS